MQRPSPHQKEKEKAVKEKEKKKLDCFQNIFVYASLVAMIIFCLVLKSNLYLSLFTGWRVRSDSSLHLPAHSYS
jgi:uncharacterized oligopeptide transporter (OPT) family protein